MKTYLIAWYALSILLLGSSVSASQMFLDFNSGSGTDRTGWTWFEDVNGYGQPGWRLNADGPFGGGQNYLWGYGPRSANKGNNNQHGSRDLARIDTANRAPSTSQGGSFHVYEPQNYGVDANRAGWWFWYDGETLSHKGITGNSTDRWEFYLKTRSPLSALTYDNEGNITSVSSQTFHIGTYVCWNDGWGAWSTGEGCPYEGPGNQHYYHYLGINPGAWINVQLDQHPQHRRGSYVIGNNPTYIDDVSGALDEDVDPDLDDDTINEPMSDGLPDQKSYMAHLHRWYMELRDSVSEPTAMWIDEMKFYSTQNTPEPDQNEESITSPWVGYWVNEDYWEIGWQDMSWTDAEGSHRGDHSHSTFEVRWSTVPITNENYHLATSIVPLFFGGVPHSGTPSLVRRPNPWSTVAWTRFTLPDAIEQTHDRIYFAIMDVSVTGGHVGTQWPWNRGDGHDAPTAYIRTIDYALRQNSTRSNMFLYLPAILDAAKSGSQ